MLSPANIQLALEIAEHAGDEACQAIIRITSPLRYNDQLAALASVAAMCYVVGKVEALRKSDPYWAKVVDLLINQIEPQATAVMDELIMEEGRG